MIGRKRRGGRWWLETVLALLFAIAWVGLIVVAYLAMQLG